MALIDTRKPIPEVQAYLQQRAIYLRQQSEIFGNIANLDSATVWSEGHRATVSASTVWFSIRASLRIA
jgi:hypothetical protein